MNSSVLHFFPRIRGLFFSMALLILLVSCMNDEENYVNQPVQVAYVAIYHAVPDAPDFNIAVDDRLINLNPFDYSSYSGYLNFYAGSRNISFKTTNGDQALIDTTFNFEDGKAYSLFAINRVSNMEALLVVDTAAAPGAGKAMVRFVHLSPDAPAFDVAASGDSTDLFSAKSFRQATGFREINGGTYSFQLQKSGTSDEVLSASDVEIVPGHYYTIITRGFANPPQGNDNALSLEILD